jgi:plastocyanin
VTRATCRAALTLGLTLAAACTDSRAGNSPDAGTPDQLADSVADSVAAEAADSPSAEAMPEADAPGSEPPFVAIAPCTRPEQYATATGPAVVGTQAMSYSPACLRVVAGTLVTIEGSFEHPLEPRTLGSPGNPIPQQQATARVLFPTPGFFAYQCPEHVDVGMLGVVWVTP